MGAPVETKGSECMAVMSSQRRSSARRCRRGIENLHLEVRREVNLRMTVLIDRYWSEYGLNKKSSEREKSIVEGIRMEMGRLFVREVDGVTVGKWYANLTGVRKLSAGTAVRHFHVMHHMMEKASTIWSKATELTGIRQIKSKFINPDDQRDPFLSLEGTFSAENCSR